MFVFVGNGASHFLLLPVINPTYLTSAGLLRLNFLVDPLYEQSIVVANTRGFLGSFDYVAMVDREFYVKFVSTTELCLLHSCLRI